MKIRTYLSTDGSEAIARIFHADGTPHPVLFCGSNVETAREGAQTWWDAELVKAANKRAPKRKPTTVSVAPEAQTVAVSDIII